MPPKRTRRISPGASGLAAGESLKRAKLAGSDYLAWSWVGIEVTQPSDITQKHCLAACGFSANSFCNNKFSSTSKSKPLKKKPSAKALGELEDDIIIVSDDESIPCDVRKCKTNPNCLNYLGQDIWEHASKAQDAFMKAMDIGFDPSLDSRDLSAPAGLKNLGATCYANAYLQVWFQNLPFRAGVYQCQPSPSDDNFEESPIFQLQVTFAAMQLLNKSVFNPVKLVESLKLRTTEQQDAQEFSKLFMAHLDSEFQRQPNAELKSLITNQFQGKQAYVTVCTQCRNRSERESEFLEIEVSIEHNAKLESRVSALLQQEDLSGDNQYFCPKCEALRDAKRYTELKELPPVLHFSLLRFVYDLSTMERKKSSQMISFPMTVDMGQFLGTASSEADSGDCNTKKPPRKLEYHLRGILLHKGASAYHGHYEAQIFDVKNQAWYQFNDEVVTKVKSLGSKTPANGINKATAHKSKTAPKTKVNRVNNAIEITNSDTSPPPATSLDDTTSRISSKDAYMLVYALSSVPSTSGEPSGSHVNIDTRAYENLMPPQRVVQKIDDLNAAHDEICEEYDKKEAEAKDHFEETRRTVMNIYQTWNLSNNAEESVVVSRSALESWMSRHLTKSSDTKGKEKVTGPVQEDSDTKMYCDDMKDDHNTVIISCSDIVCIHGRLDPNKHEKIKRIRKAVYEQIVSADHCRFSPTFVPDDVCTECVQETFQEKLYQIEHPQMVARFDRVSPIDEHVLGYWLSKPWVRDWRLPKPKMHKPCQPDLPPDSEGYGEDVRCEHGGLAPNVASRRRISGEAYQLLLSIFPNWETLPTDADVCAVCETQMYMSREDRRETKQQAEHEKSQLKHMFDNCLTGNTKLLEHVPCGIIPAQFVRDWKKWLIRPIEVERPAVIDSSQFLCRHDRLVIDPNASDDMDYIVGVVMKTDWIILESLYPAGPFIGIENNGSRWVHERAVCEGCRRERKSAFETTEVTVRLLGAGSPEPSQHTSSEKPAEDVKSKQCLITYGTRSSAGVRQSKRLQQTKGSAKTTRVTITKAMTVKELKIKLQEDLHIPTIYQRIYYQGHELEDNSMTLGSLGILSGDILDLKEDTEDIELLDADDSSRKPGGRKSTEEGQGFGGTLLAGGGTPSIDRQTDAPPAEKMSPPFVADKPCLVCTFANSVDVTACEMCETPFDSSLL